ncbi:hypothetical protein [Legionella gresilensis]|uniref:hypothetical protein n=1 Tax=Legionella gresilensis TaxID=91823 RepID=UPI0010412248|nr:hypothetical protein [Legionella gresilensis]
MLQLLIKLNNPIIIQFIEKYKDIQDSNIWKVLQWSSESTLPERIRPLNSNRLFVIKQDLINLESNDHRPEFLEKATMSSLVI